MDNELGTWLFIIFFISLFLYSKQQSYFISPDSRILWFRAWCFFFFILNNSLILFRIPEFYGLGPHGVFANLSDENSPIIFMLSFHCLKETAKKSFQWMVSS